MQWMVDESSLCYFESQTLQNYTKILKLLTFKIKSVIEAYVFCYVICEKICKLILFNILKFKTKG